MTQPPEGATEQELIAALAAALVAGAALASVAKILGRFTGIGSVAGQLIEQMGWEPLIQLTADEVALLPRDETPATRILHQNTMRNSILRAVYLINASRRLAPALTSNDSGRWAQATTIETRYRIAHEEAERKRNEAARQVAITASEYGVDARHELLLGWKAILDKRTSADCRWANGRNFNALVPPIIGYPGTVHLACRCKPVAPYPTRKRVERGTIPTHD